MFNILIVEDDYELRHLFQRVLIQNGYRVRGVEDGKAALEALEKEYADLIISDIMMPVMDGYELVRALRGSGIQTPVLMITAKDAFDDMRKGFLSGTDDYMVKPVNVNEMVLRVGALLRRAQKRHILVAHRGIRLRTGTLPSIRQHRGGKAAVFATTEDAVDGDHLDIVLVGGHRHASHGSALRAPRHEFFHISSVAPLGCGTRYVFRGFPRAPRFGHSTTLIVFLFRFYAARSAVTRRVGTRNVFYFAAATAAAISGMSASGSTCHFSVMVWLSPVFSVTLRESHSTSRMWALV